MNKRFFITVIVLATIGLMGIIAIQFFWFQKALQLKEDQFSNQAQIALKGVVNRLFVRQTNFVPTEMQCAELCDKNTADILASIDTTRLNALLKEEFSDLKIQSPYEYGIFNAINHQFVFKQPNSNTQKILVSPHRITLSCLYHSNSYVLAVYFEKEKNIVKRELIPLIILSQFLLLGLAIVFGYVVYTLNRQKKLGEMKTDFVNNMTHELKTPISTISIATEMLIKPEIAADSKRVSRYAVMIFDENNRLRLMVERVLQMAVLEKGEYNLRLRDTDIHELINELVQRFILIIKPRGGNICLILKASRFILKVDRIHFNNILSNLLDNANKYSPEKPHITITTWSDEKGFYVSVEDNGMGISAEHQKHIFRNFFRVPTKNLHNVKGFGLGLYYVKTMTEAHGGSVTVYSEFRKGTKFELFFPFNFQNNTANEQDTEESQTIIG
jgi:two-component system phosphate regulon sensor histidine kinase PhoR